MLVNFKTSVKRNGKFLAKTEEKNNQTGEEENFKIMLSDTVFLFVSSFVWFCFSSSITLSSSGPRSWKTCVAKTSRWYYG